MKLRPPTLLAIAFATKTLAQGGGGGGGGGPPGQTSTTTTTVAAGDNTETISQPPGTAVSGCPAAVSTTDICSTCVTADCVVEQTMTVPCGCPSPPLTLLSSHPCSLGCDGLGCATVYEVVTEACTQGPITSGTPVASGTGTAGGGGGGGNGGNGGGGGGAGGGTGGGASPTAGGGGGSGSSGTSAGSGPGGVATGGVTANAGCRVAPFPRFW
ncbi:hypothetical protein QBC47DRAFT_413174 [Echria macrotheca]|uniref:Uncharacterized protein n=1 Tax=Echria macrotheca TaxID=438768 RepID=A0AAJ0BEN0_9PEZI|nr:hypothetical protein QBC47DRAFT_413174 [Echria macrotheca]